MLSLTKDTNTALQLWLIHLDKKNILSWIKTNLKWNNILEKIADTEFPHSNMSIH